LKKSDTAARTCSPVKNVSDSMPTPVQNCSSQNNQTKHKLIKMKANLEAGEELTLTTHRKSGEQFEDASEVVNVDKESLAFKCSGKVLTAGWKRHRDLGVPQLTWNLSHSCKLCGRTFRQRHHLLSHSKVHRPYRCSQCVRSFRQANHLRAHFVSHRARQCDGLGAASKKTKLEHFQTKLDLNWRRLSNKICDAVFEAKRITQERLKNGPDQLGERGQFPVKNDGPLIDNLTPTFKNFKCRFDTRPIRPTETSTASKPCLSTGSAISTSGGSSGPRQLLVDRNVFCVFKHEALDRKQEPRVEVAHCSTEELSGEMASTSVKDFKCEYCRKMFWFKSTLLLHVQRTHSKVPGTTSNVAAHMSRICNFCDKTFVSEENLKDHILVHTGDKPFVCNVCDKAFALQKCLKNHFVVHSREGQFVCNICSKSFILKRYLRRHIIIHTRSPLVCNICNGKYASKWSLKRHSLMHAG